MRKSFKDIDFRSSKQTSISGKEWEKIKHIEKNWLTPERIAKVQQQNLSATLFFTVSLKFGY